MSDTLDTDQWYWDRRTRKALYPRETDDGEATVQFLSVWHTEEVADALDSEVLVPIDSVGLDRTETAFDLLDSFRTPPVVDGIDWSDAPDSPDEESD